MGDDAALELEGGVGRVIGGGRVLAPKAAITFDDGPSAEFTRF